MKTDDGEVIHVEAMSLADYARDKNKLFKAFASDIKDAGGARYAELVAMGIIEGGTESGQPSCMFLIRRTTAEEYLIFETSASGLRQLSAAVTKAQTYFETQDIGDEQ